MHTTYNSALQLLVFCCFFLFNSCAPSNQNINVDENQSTNIPVKTEVFDADLPEIIGTSWSLLCIYEVGTQPNYLRIFPEYLFCKNGKFEFHSVSNLVGQMGTYTINGNRLVTVGDGADKLTGKYIITWSSAENYLELNDGQLIFRLRYKTKTQC